MPPSDRAVANIGTAVFCNRVHGRVLRPLVATGDQPPAPTELRRALATIDRIIANYADKARLASRLRRVIRVLPSRSSAHV